MKTVLVAGDSRIVSDKENSFLVDVDKTTKFAGLPEEAKVLKADHREKALEILEANNVDTIYLDVYLPEREDFIKRARAMPQYKDIPIITLRYIRPNRTVSDDPYDTGYYTCR